MVTLLFWWNLCFWLGVSAWAMDVKKITVGNLIVFALIAPIMGASGLIVIILNLTNALDLFGVVVWRERR